ncbi:unnamed protein product [Urochloa humidicola]
MQVEDEKQAAAMATAAAEERGSGDGGEAGGERKRKRTRGRQKIEIKPIDSQAARYVCFSKRRHGLFKKASELVALCGAHVAVVAFSQAGKPHSFGYPSVNAVVGRFLDDPAAASAAAVAAPGEETARLLAPLLREFNGESERLEKAIEAEGRRRKALDAAARAAGVRGATGDDLRGARMEELLAMLAALERVQAEAADRMRMHEAMAIAEEAMMMQQQCAAAGSGDDVSGGAFTYPGAGAFAADGGAVSSHPGVMNTPTMLMMGGDVNQAPAMPLDPTMMLPPYLPPSSLICGSDHNQFAGYGYEPGDGCCHDASYVMEGYCGTVTTCNFFE